MQRARRERTRQKERVITDVNEKHNEKISAGGWAVSLDQRVHLTSDVDHDFIKEPEMNTSVSLRTYCVLFL